MRKKILASVSLLMSCLMLFFSLASCGVGELHVSCDHSFSGVIPRKHIDGQRLFARLAQS